MVKPKLYLHIGGGKTGSSALQSFFKINSEKLALDGIIYPFVQEYTQDFETSSGNANFILNENNKDQIDELKNISIRGKSVLLSSELLYNPANIQKLKAFVDIIKQDFVVCIVLYIRRQDTLTESVNVQGIKNHNWTEFRKDIGGLPTYGLLKRFSDIVGKSNFILKVYEKQQFVGGNIFQDFLNIMGIEMCPDYKLPLRPSNPPMDRDFLEMKRICNALPYSESVINKNFKNAFWRLSNLDSYVPFSKHNIFSPKERSSILEKYADDNEQIAKEFLLREDGVLFYEKIQKDDSWDEYEGVPIEQIITGFAYLNIIGQQRIENLEKKVKILTEELDRLRKYLDE